MASWNEPREELERDLVDMYADLAREEAALERVYETDRDGWTEQAAAYRDRTREGIAHIRRNIAEAERELARL